MRLGGVCGFGSEGLGFNGISAHVLRRAWIFFTPYPVTTKKSPRYSKI